jgi:hypothetical protein
LEFIGIFEVLASFCALAGSTVMTKEKTPMRVYKSSFDIIAFDVKQEFRMNSKYN